MTHTQTVALILDATRKTGILFHGLTETQRENARKHGRAYMIGHCTGNRNAMEVAESDLLQAVRK